MLKLLLDPRAEGAFFADTVAVALAEVGAVFPAAEPRVDARASVTFLDVSLPEDAAPALLRLAAVQAVFAPEGGGLRLVDAEPGFALPAELVWGAKYRGKTHELATQLALNVALAHCRAEGPPKLLDPMAGRGSTLLWAARYGLEARGIEHDPRALPDFQRHVKGQCTLQRLKHQERQGSVHAKRKDGVGRFLEYRFGERALKLITGDARDAPALLGGERVHLIVADLPYGVQHVGPTGTRDPLPVLRECAPGWAELLKPGGAMVLIYNRFLPKREALVEAFEAAGLAAEPFEAPHRMSASILRDLAVFTRP